PPPPLEWQINGSGIRGCLQTLPLWLGVYLGGKTLEYFIAPTTGGIAQLLWPKGCPTVSDRDPHGPGFEYQRRDSSGGFSSGTIRAGPIVSQCSVGRPRYRKSLGPVASFAFSGPPGGRASGPRYHSGPRYDSSPRTR